MSPSVKVSQEHKRKLEEISDEMDFRTSNKAIVEGLIDDYYEENISEGGDNDEQD